MTSGISALQMGSKHTLTQSKNDWLWNVAKRALPAGSPDSDVLHYMRYLAEQNGIKLDANNDVDRSKLPKEIKVPKYVAPAMADIKKGRTLAPHMSGPGVVELKQMLNKMDPSLKLDEKSNTYDPATRAALATLQKKKGIRPRKDGLVSGATISALQKAYPPVVSKDKVDTSNEPTTPLKKTANTEIDSKATKTPETVKELYKDKNFAGLDARKRSDVIKAMREGTTDERQKYIGSLGTKEHFGSLNVGERKQVLQLANTDDKEMRQTLDEMVSKTDFKDASPEVRKGLIDLLSENGKSAKDVRDILAVKDNTLRLEMVEQAKAGWMPNKTPQALTDLKKSPAWAKLAPDAQKDVQSSMLNQTPEAAKLMSELAQSKNFGRLSDAERKAVLELAEKPSADMATALKTITGSEHFIKASAKTKSLVFKALETKPGNAKDVAHALHRESTPAKTDQRLQDIIDNKLNWTELMGDTLGNTTRDFSYWMEDTLNISF